MSTEKTTTAAASAPTTAAPAAEATMAQKLEAAGKKAEEAKKTRQVKAVKGAHLLDKTLELLKAEGLTTEEKSGFVKATSGVKGKALYVARKGGRIDLSGFTVTHAAVTQITEAQATEKHLGRVRGQVDFEKSDHEVMAALKHAVTELKAPLPEAPKVAKPPKEKKPKAEKTEASAPAPTPTAESTESAAAAS